MLLIFFTLAAGVLAYTFRRRLLQALVPGRIPGIPAYDDSKPILGDLPKIIKAIKEHDSFRVFFDAVGRDLGPIAQIRLGPLKTFVVLSDYQEIESVCSRNADFDRGFQTTEIFDQLIPTAQISQPTNTMWKHHRRLIGPAMTSKYLASNVPRANEAVSEVVELFEARIERAEGRAWAVEPVMVAATMDVICGMAFGESWGIARDFTRQVQTTPPTIGSLDEAIFTTEMPQLAKSTIALLDSVPTTATFPRLHKLQNRFSPAYNRHYSLVFDYIKERLALARERGHKLGEEAVDLADNTLDMMVAREMRGDVMSDAELRDEIFLYLVAGTETSAVTLSWWFKYMTNTPRVQHKLRAHLERLPQPITADSISAVNTPYLEAVVQETLRLSRTAGGVSREAKHDTVVLGHVVPKGTTVLLSSSFQHETHNSPAWRGDAAIASKLAEERSDNVRKVGYWKDGTGQTFDPDRWIKEGAFDQSAGPSLPFSSGQRGCFGKNLALLELRLVIAHLTQAFFFAPVAENQNSMKMYESITGHPRQSFIRPIPWRQYDAMSSA